MARTSRDWQAKVKGLLRAELARRQLSYVDLAERLEAIGIKEDPRNIKNKIGRGSFTAVFFFQCMEAIGVQNIHLNGMTDDRGSAWQRNRLGRLRP
jgi:uncharacterized protein DUF6471